MRKFKATLTDHAINGPTVHGGIGNPVALRTAPGYTGQMAPFQVRPEKPDDTDAVAALHVRAWQRGYAGIVPDDFLATLDPAAWAQRRRERLDTYRAGPFVSLVAADGTGRLGGFTTVGPYQNDQNPADIDGAHGQLLAIYVDPPLWGTGAGRALMDAAMAELTGRGYPDVRLWVLADNARARRFYERAGLTHDGTRAMFRLDRITGTADGAGGGVELVEVRYAARLPRPAGPHG